MPLVTRSSVQGNLYRQAAAPVGPNTGDVWVDTDNGIISTYDGAAWVQQSPGALGSANLPLRMNAGATAQTYAALGTVGGGTGLTAIGTTLQVLRTNAGATALEYATPTSAFELLNYFEVAATQSSYTFTSTLDFDIYSAIIVEFDLEGAATFVLQAVINAVGGSVNNTKGISFEGTAITHISVSNAAQIQIGSTSVEHYGRLIIKTADYGSQDIYGDSVDSLAQVLEINTHHISTATGGDITSIKLQTSTSTWLNGSKITIYGLRRT